MYIFLRGVCDELELVDGLQVGITGRVVGGGVILLQDGTPENTHPSGTGALYNFLVRKNTSGTDKHPTLYPSQLPNVTSYPNKKYTSR
jgi:hypothetical protein